MYEEEVGVVDKAAYQDVFLTGAMWMFAILCGNLWFSLLYDWSVGLQFCVSGAIGMNYISGA